MLARSGEVAAATVTLPEAGCAGAVVGESDQVLTAAHCIAAGAEAVTVAFGRGQRVEGVVALIDRERDTALLALEEPLPVAPLAWGSTVEAGDRVLFVGRVDRKSKTQVSTVQRVGRCPSLPRIDDAVFTNLEARRGDSGSPIVDRKLRVVGVIHGGARCHIAAPTVHLARQLTGPGTLLSDVLPDPEPAPAQPKSPPSARESRTALRRVPRVLKTYSLGPLVIEKLEHGIRFRFHLELSTDSESE